MLCPMHLPVLLCGFLCGMPYGLFVGLVAPFLRFALFGMPALYPSAAAMAVELACYGFFAGLFFKLFPKKLPFFYLTLVLAMLVGRGIWGLTRFVMASVDHTSFTFDAFLTSAFVNASFGILIQIILIPILVFSLQKAKLIPESFLRKK